VVNPALPRTGPTFGSRLSQVARRLGWESTILETRAGSNVEAIGAALARGTFSMVIAAGGDGTVAEVMAAAHGRSIDVGIVPCGTGNIVARELGLPAGWRKGLRRILRRNPNVRPVDLARVNDGYSVLAAGMGLDALIIRHTPSGLKYWLGRFAYFLVGTWIVPTAPIFHCVIRADGAEFAVAATMVLVANAGMLGGGPFRFAPGIAIDDGWLDLCIYQPASIAGRARVLWGIVSGRPAEITQRKVRSVEIKATDQFWHEVDGEVKRGNVVRAEIIPGGINVVV
jgi:diacylglycerol kinase (ATP)